MVFEYCESELPLRLGGVHVLGLGLGVLMPGMSSGIPSLDEETSFGLTLFGSSIVTSEGIEECTELTVLDDLGPP